MEEIHMTIFVKTIPHFESCQNTKFIIAFCQILYDSACSPTAHDIRTETIPLRLWMVDIGVVVLSHVTTFCYWSHEEGTVDI
jgi:hypothetical protein